MDWCVSPDYITTLAPDVTDPNSGQVVALFIVGFGEYAVVWLGTDWNKEVQKGIDRNKEQAQARRLHAQENSDNSG